MLNYAATIRDHLFSLTTRGIKLGLDSMHKACESFGNPQNAYPCFHVAGTNGKGSVCAYLESSLRSVGHTTGLFTSPHIIDFEERFCINGIPIAPSDWVEVYKDVVSVIDKYELTFFEATTLLAFELFKRKKVSYAVFETGMGGRLDATNLVVPVVSVITTIDLDHCEYLGPDRVSIAGEKLGIVKKDVPLVMIDPEDEEISTVAVSVCAAVGSTCEFVRNETVPQTEAFGSIPIGKHVVTLPLAGSFQRTNAMLALRALQIAGITHERSLVQGISHAYVPGRIDKRLIDGREWIFDVGHNPQAAEVFIKVIQAMYPGVKRYFIVGIMHDKDFKKMIPLYATAASVLILTSPKTSRAAPARSLAEQLPLSESVFVHETLADAIAFTKTHAPAGACICVCGSFYTVGEALITLGETAFKPTGSLPSD